MEIKSNILDVYFNFSENNDASQEEQKYANFKSWKTKIGFTIFPGSPIFNYTIGGEKTVKSFKAAKFGTVRELAQFKPGDTISAGDFILKMTGCEHNTVMKDMCADCGENLRTKDGLPGERVVTTKARVSMIHSIPELQVTLDEAKKLGTADEENILKNRKLVLLVDLDQTLIHTTNEDVVPDLKDVYHFQLYGPNSPWYHVRLRPNTRHFLDSMRSLYEMHICTFGVRMYAHKIASILDPDGSIFGHRILSRDECFNSSLKTANLKALFPCGDRLVCVIDDREDVWNYSSNVIRVKPYRYFKNTGDINAPPGFGKTESNTNGGGPRIAENLPDTKSADQEKSVDESESADFQSESTDKLETAPDWPKSAEQQPKSRDSEPVESRDPGHHDEDDYLYFLEEILKKIHTVFYQLHDQMPESERPPDLHSVIPYVKLKVLKNVNLVFSGVIPTTERPADSYVYNLAKNFGANIQDNVTTPQNILPSSPGQRPRQCPKKQGLLKTDSSGPSQTFTTHLVAAKLGTSKVRQAQNSGGQVKIVTPKWLFCCAERWEKVEERLFPLTPDYVYEYGPQKNVDVTTNEQQAGNSNLPLKKRKFVDAFGSYDSQKIDSDHQKNLDDVKFLNEQDNKDPIINNDEEEDQIMDDDSGSRDKSDDDEKSIDDVIDDSDSENDDEMAAALEKALDS